jgi:hypothetical protein
MTFSQFFFFKFTKVFSIVITSTASAQIFFRHRQINTFPLIMSWFFMFQIKDKDPKSLAFNCGFIAVNKMCRMDPPFIDSNRTLNVTTSSFKRALVALHPIDADVLSELRNSRSFLDGVLAAYTLKYPIEDYNALWKTTRKPEVESQKAYFKLLKVCPVFLS